jgi:hypothetical protein
MPAGNVYVPFHGIWLESRMDITCWPCRLIALQYKSISRKLPHGIAAASAVMGLIE